MKKKFRASLVIISVTGLLGTLYFGLCWPSKHYNNPNINLVTFISILYDISVGVLASTVIVWGVDFLQQIDKEKRLQKQHILLYKKLEPFLNSYYDFFLKLYIATRNFPVPKDSIVLSSLYGDIDAFLQQLITAQPFDKDSYMGDPQKIQAMIRATVNNPSLSEEGFETIINMSKSYPWYKCFCLEAKKFYDGLIQIEKDYTTLFSNELLEKAEKLLTQMEPQIHIIENVEGSFIKQYVPKELLTEEMLHFSLPAEFYIEEIDIKTSLKLLEDLIAFIENDSELVIRNRTLDFFNGRKEDTLLGSAINA